MTTQRTLLAALLSTLAVSAGADWPQFRGPDATASSAEALPVTWSENENLIWKTALPGPGSSSPIVVGDKIFLTCYSGYALSADEPGQRDALTHRTVCLDRATGKILWDKAAKAAQPETDYTGWILQHGYASGTPASDGQAVYAFFGRSGVCAYSLAGERLWHADVGQGTHQWGSGTSPVLTERLVIINASVESESLVALDKKAGKEVWRVEGIKDSWSTPCLVDLPQGARELVVSLRGKILGLEPATGKQLWECEGVPDYVCPSVIAHQGIVYVTGGRRPPYTMAIRARGRGDVSATHKLWEVRKTPKVATPVYHEGFLYFIDHRGVATCLKAESGEVVYEERLNLAGQGDTVYASLVQAGGKLYGLTRHDGTLVFAAGPTFAKLAQNRFGEDSLANATPAVADGRLYLRSDRFLYCVGKQ